MARKARTEVVTKRKYTRRPKPVELLVAKCIFAGTPGKEYHYIIPEGCKANPGDYGVVDTVGSYSGSSSGYARPSAEYEIKTVKIVGVTTDFSQARKFLVMVIPTDLRHQTNLLNATMKEKIESWRVAREALDSMLRNKQEQDRYALLRNDPAAQEHLKVLGY